MCEVLTKICSKCHLEKTLGEFCKDKDSKDGLYAQCKNCAAQKTKKWYKQNKARELVIVPDFKMCPGCKTEKPNSDFYKAGRNKDGLGDYCKECNAIRVREYLYGITDEQFKAMLETQGGACAICRFIPGSEDESLHVDHIHGTEIVRGLLHSNCNRGLGYFKDNVGFISKAIEYLRSPHLGIKYNRHLPKSIKDAILASQDY